MIVIERKRYIFTTKEVWFSDYIGDISGCHQVTFRRCKAKVNVEGFTCKESPTIVINLNQGIDTIWNDMDKSSCRYAVKRAKRDNIEIETETFRMGSGSYKMLRMVTLGISGIQNLKAKVRFRKDSNDKFRTGPESRVNPSGSAYLGISSADFRINLVGEPVNDSAAITDVRVRWQVADNRDARGIFGSSESK